MTEDFQTIRERVRNGEHLKANIIKLYKWRNVLRPIQPWEADAAGQRQNYMAVREKQELIQQCQTAIDRKLGSFRKAVWTAIFALLLAVTATVLGEYLYARFFSSANNPEQTKPQTIRNIQKPTANTPATSTTNEQHKSKSKKE